MKSLVEDMEYKGEAVSQNTEQNYKTMKTSLRDIQYSSNQSFRKRNQKKRKIDNNFQKVKIKFSNAEEKASLKEPTDLRKNYTYMLKW